MFGIPIACNSPNDSLEVASQALSKDDLLPRQQIDNKLVLLRLGFEEADPPLLAPNRGQLHDVSGTISDFASRQGTIDSQGLASLHGHIPRAMFQIRSTAIFGRLPSLE